MSAKIFKLIRRYAELRRLRYETCKLVYLKASPEEQKQFKKEMENAPFNDPVIKVYDKLTGKTKTFRPSKIKAKIKPAFEIKDLE